MARSRTSRRPTKGFPACPPGRPRLADQHDTGREGGSETSARGVNTDSAGTRRLRASSSSESLSVVGGTGQSAVALVRRACRLRSRSRARFASPPSAGMSCASSDAPIALAFGRTATDWRSLVESGALIRAPQSSTHPRQARHAPPPSVPATRAAPSQCSALAASIDHSIALNRPKKNGQTL